MALRRRFADLILSPFGQVIDLSDHPDIQQYGFGEVSAARRQELFNAHARLDDEGFTEVQRGFFVREAGEEIHQVLSHFSANGSTHFRWGVSLAFVPHEFRKRVRFHRTLKTAELDLFDQDWRDDGACYLYTELPWLRDMEAMWGRAWPRGVAFWDRARNVVGVARVAEQLSAATPTESGFTQDGFFITGPSFVRSMALARLGREAEARAALAEWAARCSGADLGSRFGPHGAEVALERVLALPPLEENTTGARR